MLHSAGAGGRGECSGNELMILEWSFPVDLSIDGKSLLMDEQGQGGGSAHSTYLRTTDGSPAVRLGDGGAQTLSPESEIGNFHFSQVAWQALPTAN